MASGIDADDFAKLAGRVHALEILLLEFPQFTCEQIRAAKRKVRNSVKVRTGSPGALSATGGEPSVTLSDQYVEDALEHLALQLEHIYE